MEERYCEPISLPCWLGVVGLCNLKNSRVSSRKRADLDQT